MFVCVWRVLGFPTESSEPTLGWVGCWFVGHFSEEDVRRLMVQIFSAVACLHSQGVIHRDIKVLIPVHSSLLGGPCMPSPEAGDTHASSRAAVCVWAPHSPKTCF